MYQERTRYAKMAAPKIPNVMPTPNATSDVFPEPPSDGAAGVEPVPGVEPGPDGVVVPLFVLGTHGQ